MRGCGDTLCRHHQEDSMRSMTGMGIGQAHAWSTAIRVEIRSVNNRFLDLAFRMPSALAAFEAGLREKIQAGVTRGRVTVHVDLERGQDEVEVRFNEPFIHAVLAAAREVAERQGIEADLDLA